LIAEEEIERNEHCAQTVDGTIFCLRRSKKGCVLTTRSNGLIVFTEYAFKLDFTFYGVMKNRAYFITIKDDELVVLYYAHIYNGAPKLKRLKEIENSLDFRILFNGYYVHENSEGDVSIFRCENKLEGQKPEIIRNIGSLHDVIANYRGSLIRVQIGKSFQIRRTHPNILHVLLPNWKTKLFVRDHLPFLYVIDSDAEILLILDIETMTQRKVKLPLEFLIKLSECLTED
ncbi:hypothetical protein PFISCL1PPCAC_2950, partial [Pristionchus fissidentatus]